MATYTEGDTFPPFRGWVRDQTGELADLTLADSVEVVYKSSGATITLTATVLSPPELDADGVTEYNWKADLEADTCSVPGTYEEGTKVTWDAAATPPKVEWFPSSGSGPTLTIKPKLA